MGNSLNSLVQSNNLLRTLLSRSRMTHELSLPSSVSGMKQWQPELFNTKVVVPCVRVPKLEISLAKKSLDKFALKLPHVPNIVDEEMATSTETYKLLRLDPRLVKSNQDVPESSLMSAVLGEELNLSSFSNIGHVVHVNLKERHQPYKHVIGQILLLRKGAKIAVNKTSAIDNTFRNFEFEVLAGSGSLEVTTSESGCRFQLDFSKVYWNPRLSTEHERVIKLIVDEAKEPNKKVIVADVFAGVGPFAVPLGKRKSCNRVLANDLNPESYKWLKVNVEKNAGEKRVKCFNMDGREFIREVVKQALLNKEVDEDPQESSEESTTTTLHVIMNLPALAIEFLDAFRGLLHSETSMRVAKIVVHVYGFTEHKGEEGAEELLKRINQTLNSEISDKMNNVLIKQYVRNVAPNRHMMRISFQMPHQIILNDQVEQEPKNKRSRTT